MSSSSHSDASHSSSESDLPSTEAEFIDHVPDDHKKFTVIIKFLHDGAIQPTQCLTSEKLICNLFNPKTIYLKPQQQIIISLGLSLFTTHPNYYYNIKQNDHLEETQLKLCAYFYDHHTKEIKLVIQNINQHFERRLSRGEKIARVVFRKRRSKEIEFISE